MSAYQGRTGPNFSEYLNGLNALGSPYDEENFASESLDLNQDLAMFTNTDFTHYDIPALPDDMNFDLGNEKGDNVKFEELLSSADTQSFNAPITQSPTEASQFYPSYNTPIQPAPPQGFGLPDNNLQQQGVNRSRGGSAQTTLSAEDKTRFAAEEDKRRRNTAASARFRVKKKQREQALERNMKEAADKASKLEARLNQLEMENKWLKDLITEKHAVQSIEEVEQAYQKYKRESEERTEGVGTA